MSNKFLKYFGKIRIFFISLTLLPIFFLFFLSISPKSYLKQILTYIKVHRLINTFFIKVFIFFSIFYKPS
ncbi:hypothetical protein A7Q09_04950 [Methylacidiphilum sp. Yel]|nr:hypothetical protein A7Q09_04950 [Methylacidiphilum sp. Yel]